MSMTVDVLHARSRLRKINRMHLPLCGFIPRMLYSTFHVAPNSIQQSFIDRVYFSGSPISSSPNSIAQIVKRGFCRKMAHSALAASSMFTTTSTLFHGHTIAVIHANITTLDGAQRSSNHSHDTCVLHFQRSFHKKVVCREAS